MTTATAETIDILGTWQLVTIEEWLDGDCINPFVYGREPNGFIHYLPGNRMAAVIARGGRERLVLSSPSYGVQHTGRTLKAVWRRAHLG